MKKRAVVSEAGTTKVSRPFEYAGYSFPEYKSYVRSSHYVSMFDGTKLAVDVYLPSDGPSQGPFPVLLNYHPYRRAAINPATGAIEGVLFSGELQIKFYSSYGYALAFADMRGSGASFGSRMDMSPPLARDGKQVIDWIETQPWCNGKVGMIGGSYQGWSQFATAGQKPRALKAIIPEVIPFDMFSGCLFYCAGIYFRGLIESWGAGIWHADRAAYIPAAGFLPATPVIDKDGDGELADEIPQYPDGKFFFFDDPPTYRDGKKRQNIYYNAVREHLNNLDVRHWAPAAPYRNSQIGDTGYTWTDVGPSDWPLRLAESGVAIYHVGAWLDFFTLGTTQWYATLKETNPSKMLIHPSFHGSLDLPISLGPYWHGEDAGTIASRMLKERVRFFDRYLKGIQNGIDTEPPITIYVMNGGGWRSENEWPLARQVVSKYYLEGGNSLSKSKATGGDQYKVDLTHDSRCGTNKLNRWNPYNPLDFSTLDQPIKRTDIDLKCLTYTSKPLEQDTEVTGHPIVHLWVSSTADNGDFFCYLEDMDEKGEAYYVTEGKLRAGFAGLVPQEDMLASHAPIKVLPNLPYHGYKDTDYLEKIFAAGSIVELVFDLLPTSWTFKEGHRIRVSIACADWPTFDLHPTLSPKNDPNDLANIVPTITVYHDAKHPSRIELPIIPPRSKKASK